MPRKRFNNFHKPPISAEKKQRNEDARNIGVKFFGPPNDPVRLKVDSAVRFFDAILGEDMSYEEFQQQDLESMMADFPFVKHMLDHNVIPPPAPPTVLSKRALDDYLRASRQYRLLHPTLDRATKKDPKSPCRDSTYLKFELGIDTTSSLHVGAGRVIGSSVPLASRFIDWMQNSEIFEDREISEKLIVSDAAIPSGDGLGCGEYPGLVAWIIQCSRMDVEWGKMPIIAKFSLMDLEKLTDEGVHYSILYKPRAHNMEVIVGINIPSVSLDEEEIMQGILDHNIWRNDCCYEASIPYDEEPAFIDEALLCDNKDYDVLLETIGVDITRPVGALGDARHTQTDVNPDQLETLIDAGFFEYTDTINKIALQKAFCAMENFDRNLQKGECAYVPRDRFEQEIQVQVDERHYRMRGKTRIKGKFMAKCYPVVMWLDVFPEMGVRSLASLVQVIDFIRDGILEISQKNRRLVWEDLRRQCGRKAVRKKE